MRKSPPVSYLVPDYFLAKQSHFQCVCVCVVAWQPQSDNKSPGNRLSHLTLTNKGNKCLSQMANYSGSKKKKKVHIHQESRCKTSKSTYELSAFCQYKRRNTSVPISKSKSYLTNQITSPLQKYHT